MLNPLFRRTVAGCLDAFFLGSLAAAFYWLPLLKYGFSLPMWGLLAAIVAYSVIPLSAFRATLGMRLLGVELVGKDGRGVNAVDVLFRELVGRGLFPAVFLLTLLLGAIASWAGWTRTSMPTGLGSVMGLVSLAVVIVALPGHLLPFLRKDERSLADLVARTQVRLHQPAVAPEDEDERYFWAQQRRQRWVRAVAFEVVILVGGFALPWMLTRPTESTQTYADRITRLQLEKDFQRAPENEVTAQQLTQMYRRAGDVESEAKVQARHLQALTEGLSCNKQRALRLGERLSEQERYEAALTVVEQFQKECGAWLRLEWVALHAREQFGEWKAATEIATRLIEDDPEDPDFWWWRGRDFAKLGQYEQAAADFHQSLAVRPNGFAAGEYAQWAKDELGRPCEPAFALGYWMSQNPDEAADGAQSALSELFLAGDCGKHAGRGKTTLRLRPGTETVTELGSIGGEPIKWVAYPPAPYTVIDQATQTRLGLSTEGVATVQLRISGQTMTAHLVTLGRVQVGRAWAEGLTAAVVEELPEGTQALLGVNFLWRFQTRLTEDGVELAPMEGTQLSRFEY